MRSEGSEDLFIAMERLEGESLGDRLQRGPLPPQEAAQVALGALAALEVVHARGLLHRDLKPSNVFLTPHGVKLLDFGLAIPIASSTDASHTAPMLTLPGTVLGTPAYMSPEQILSKPIDARSDLYSLGAMLFEMLSGKSPFEASGPTEILARALSERPPALGGSPAVIAIDRIVQPALARNPDDRYQDAASMAHELRGALRFVDSGATTAAQPIRRVIVLLFRLLRPDPEIDFLAFGLADAISASLSGTETLVVRSSLAAARYAGALPDLAVLAAEADVDLVVSGTTMRAGDQIRVTAQLVEAPRGTLLWSHTQQAKPYGPVSGSGRSRATHRTLRERVARRHDRRRTGAAGPRARAVPACQSACITAKRVAPRPGAVRRSREGRPRLRAVVGAARPGLSSHLEILRRSRCHSVPRSRRCRAEARPGDRSGSLDGAELLRLP
jgi:TolB-like protein